MLERGAFLRSLLFTSTDPFENEQKISQAICSKKIAGNRVGTDVEKEGERDYVITTYIQLLYIYYIIYTINPREFPARVLHYRTTLLHRSI